MQFRNAILSISVAMSFAQLADAQTLYRWTDPQGRVHYTDSAPPSTAKESRTVTTDAAADQRAADSLREQNDALSKRSADRNKSPEDREREKKEADRKARCGQLMAIVNAVDRGDSLFRQNEKGEKTEITGNAREFEKVRSGQQFQLECQDLANSASNASKSAASKAAGQQPAANPAASNPGSSNSGSAAPSSGGAASSGSAPTKPPSSTGSPSGTK
jgi:Domain of unknown function (DUF4124)